MKSTRARSARADIDEGMMEHEARHDLIPQWLLDEVAEVLGHGAVKHGETSWQTDERPQSTHLLKARSHMVQWERGDWIDEDSGCSHAAHVLARVALAADRQRRGLP
jgi:hypothetical protein